VIYRVYCKLDISKCKYYTKPNLIYYWKMNLIVQHVKKKEKKERKKKKEKEKKILE
jgi:hypothetical protein